MVTQEEDRPAKRRKLDATLPEEVLAAAEPQHQGAPHKGLDRPISPPLSKRKSPIVSSTIIVPTREFGDVSKSANVSTSSQSNSQQDGADERDGVGKKGTTYVPSPIQLTHIEHLAPHQNVDAVRLKDVLGNPLIKECWNFNFLFDIDFVMKHFDEDVKDIVKVKIIHGFWKNDDERRINLLETAERYPNVDLHHAYIPDPFGTHHSKMLVLFRHDNVAQVVIHTANMISRDWSNMTQAVWCSPLLPLLSPTAALEITTGSDITAHPIGSGERFKVDFLRYLKAYGNRIVSLTTQLLDYDFSAIKAAFIGSAPSRQKFTSAKPSKQTSFGWLGLQEVLSTVPIHIKDDETNPSPHIVVQVSSIATLGAVPTWLTQFQSVLSRSAVDQSVMKTSPSTFFLKREAANVKEGKLQSPKFNVVFPTPEEIRTSLDGWASGGSIHMKLQSQQQQKQLEYMHPLFCHWKPSFSATNDVANTQRHGGALRGPAAPHIKTYVRFSGLDHRTMDWAMVTSANLSKQAWGDVVNKKDEIWIQSWEAGVIVWPALFAEPNAANGTVMVPVFGKDMPGSGDICDIGDDEESNVGDKVVVGFRMPYDLPLAPYMANEKPWCATMQYSEPDWKGLAWGGY